MKKGLLLFSFLFMVVSAKAQENTSDESSNTQYRNEIGLNVTTFIQNILGFSSNDIQHESPYLITYKRHFNKKALRLGFGGAFSSSDDDENGIQVDDFETDLRIGFEFQSYLSSWWTFYAGIDAVAHFSSLKTTSVQSVNQDIDKVVTESNLQSYGGGPVVGIQFNINPRLNLSTDASLYLLLTSDNRKVNSSLFPEFNTNMTENSTELRFTVPFSIFLKFRL